MKAHAWKRSDNSRSRRYAGSAFVSLLIHAFAALLLSLFIVTPVVKEEVIDALIVEFPAWVIPKVAPKPRPEPPQTRQSPTPSQETAEEPPPEPGPRKPTAQHSPALITGGTPMAPRESASAPIRPEPRPELAKQPDRPLPNSPQGVPRNNPRANVEARFSPLRADHVPVAQESVPLRFPEGEITGESPQVSRNGGSFRVERGFGSENAPAAGGYGTNANGIPGVSNATFRNLMTNLARGIVDNTTSAEVDVVFLLDTTLSMEDNVRGVQAYVDEFVNILVWARRNPRFGLVTFADDRKGRPKVRGLTDDTGEFRNWIAKEKMDGGGDIAEDGLEAIMEGISRTKFRKNSHKHFIFMSDAPFHDRDYDTQSEYTLDEVIASLKSKRVLVDTVGLDFLPVKQLAWGTGGRWIPIPGKGYLEQITLPLPIRSNAALGVLSTKLASPRDEVLVFAQPNRRPDWVELRWRVLSPRGEKVAGEFIERFPAPTDSTRMVLRPTFDPSWFQGNPGYYTAIYRIEDSTGFSSVLRRVIDYR